MTKYNVEVISKHCCELGEGPHWDPKSQTLYYVDLMAGDVCQLDPKTQESKIVHFGNIVSSVIPIIGAQNEFIMSEDNKLFKINLETKQKELLVEIDQKLPGNRFNDAKCDSFGRLWIGTMGPEPEPGVFVTDRGALYSYEASKLEKKFEVVDLSNGIAWSLDNTKMYFIDSVKRFVYSFDFDIKSGNIKNSTVFFDFNKTDYPKNVLPDGMTIDKTGNLWVACFNGAKVINICTKTGRVIDTVNLPTSCITSVCFGGPKLDQLFVTTASKPLDAQRRADEPKAGHLFRITSDSPNFAGFETSYNFSQ